MGRLILTHSTHIEGIIKILNKLVKTDAIKSITPGVLSKTRAKSEKLTLKITRPTVGGFKLVARKGVMAQEIYIITCLDKDELSKKILEVFNS